MNRNNARLEQALLVGKLVFPRIHVDGQAVPRLQGEERAMEEDQFCAGQKMRSALCQSPSVWCQDHRIPSHGLSTSHTHVEPPYLPR